MPRRKAWDDAMQASGHAPLKQKSKRAKSGRQVVLSKAMKVVDDETRRQVRNARLEKLESDNYTEDLDEAGAEEEYRDEEEVTLTSTSSRSKVAGGKGRKPAKKGLRHKFKYTSFNQLVLDTTTLDDEDGPTYLSIAAAPSNRPPRKFCSVCGYFGNYTCTRCGVRYCSLKCESTHKETRCLKFAV